MTDEEIKTAPTPMKIGKVIASTDAKYFARMRRTMRHFRFSYREVTGDRRSFRYEHWITHEAMTAMTEGDIAVMKVAALADMGRIKVKYKVRDAAIESIEEETAVDVWEPRRWRAWPPKFTPPTE